ncbi:signal transduction histidine kinase [Nocardioides zeae]|nr:signal transduction histidine kinase [Nocardioides zeae]
MSREPLAGIGSVKVKLGVLVAASVTVATLVASLGRAASVPLWLSLPVTVLLALAVTQLLAVGMTSPLRQMTAAARRMARGDYTARVADGSRDEVGELARAFNTMAGDLGDVDRRRRELVATVSHELRTPLAGLRAVLENLVDDVGAPGPEARHAALATALGQAERMSGLVEDLLDLARVDAGHAPLRPEAVDVAALLDACVAEAVTAAGPRGRAVTYAVDVDPVELTVRADPARLHQLVANLLDNAARHSPAGGTVRATAGPGPDGGLRLQVHDEGPGVPPAERDRVFEAFGTGSGGGTGLGLAVARWVVDLHGGAIRFVDPVGPTGARVQVDLPPAPTPSPSPTTPEATVSTPLPTRPVPGRDAPVRPPGVVDDLVGDFWPDDGVPARLRVLLASLGVGLLGAVVLPFRDHGIGAALVLLAAGGVVLGAAKHRRAPFTLASAALCALLAATVAVRDAEWIAFLCALTGAALCVIGVTRGRTLPAFVLAGLSWPLAGLRGLPWLGRTLARLTGLGQGRGAAADRGAVGARPARVRRPPHLGRRAAGGVGRRAAPRPHGRHAGAPRLPDGGDRRRGARRGVPRPQPPAGRPRPAAGPSRRAPLRVAGPRAGGGRRGRGLPRRAGGGGVRRARLPAPYDGAHLRRVRPPGLRPAHRRHRADPRRRRGRRAEGPPGDRR